MSAARLCVIGPFKGILMNLTSGLRRSSLRPERLIGARNAMVRLLPITLALAWAAPGLVMAATPASDTLTPATKGLKITYSAGPFAASNPAGTATDGPVCNAAAPCDSFKLTITTPAGSIYTRAKISVEWGADSLSDYDVYVYNGDVGDLDGMTPADVGDSAGSSNPESLTINLEPGTHAYTIKTVPFQVVPRETDVVGTIELMTGSTGGGGGGGGGNGDSCSIPAGVRP